MNLFDVTNPLEAALERKTAIRFEPLGGSMELLPICNMNCKMCYVHQSSKEVESQGGLLSCDEWLEIAKKAKEAGVLFLLLTGGEPLLYPEFPRLYKELQNMGFVLSINTNGTLIDETMAKILAENMPRQINITIYGPDDETYKELCGNPKGFTQMMEATRWLEKYKIPYQFHFSAVPQNADKVSKIMRLAKEKGIHIAPSYYMFPPSRIVNEQYSRLTPERVVDTWIEGFSAQHNGEIYMSAKISLDKMINERKTYVQSGLACKGGRNGFWINWKGELLPCGMFTHPNISIKNRSFKDAWKLMVEETQKLHMCEKCQKCKKSAVCLSCAAASVTETGSTKGCPDYLCEVTDIMIKKLLNYIPEEERKKYIEYLKDEDV